MKFPRLLAACLAFAAPLLAVAQPTPGTTVSTPQVRAELLAHAPEGVEPGKPVWVGLEITHQPHWHTYWKNPGDSGLPTELAWTLPAGIVAGDIAWPLPRRIPIGPLVNFGYEDKVLLPVPLTVAPDFKASPLANEIPIRLKASWLVCQKECIPQEGEFLLKLPVRSTTALNGPAFDAALASVPKPALPDTGIVPASSARIDGDALVLTVQDLPVAVRGKTLDFFPETGEVIDNAAPITQSWNGAVWKARVPLSSQRSAGPDTFPVVLATGHQGWRAALKVTGTWPPVAAPATVSPALEQALRANAATPAPAPAPAIGFATALLFALVGGLILNLMPCVFPVLAIKVVGITQHANDRRGQRASALAYTAGVIVSFLALGGAMLALRAAGEQLGWGFQLQYPGVVAALAALFTLIALNFAGVFEFGGMLPSSLASLQAKHPVLDAFLTGVLAVAVASPCTAPFMGASLGLAISLPAVEALALFALLGLGLALPYLVAGFVPGVVRWLPRPGPWMETFRRLMAFPMFAAVAWLVWVLGQQTGVDGAGALLALLVAMSMVVWALTLRGRARVALGALALAALGGVAWTTGAAITRVPTTAPVTAAEGAWQPWSADRVQQLVGAGQPVFVDFTAAWCVTCQYNKRTTLSHPDVHAAFEAGRYTLLRADWTRRDPAITAALTQLGRSGVPVYVVYRPGRAPQVLSEVLSVPEVLGAVAPAL